MRAILKRCLQVAAGSLIILGCMAIATSYRSIGVWRSEVILSGSMRPAVPTGSLVLLLRVPESSYRAGDIVSFRSPQGGASVTHRIRRVFLSPGSGRVVETKGDANTNGDPWLISTGALQGKVVLTVPGAGYVLSMVKTRIGFLVLAIVTFVAFVVPRVRFAYRHVRFVTD